MSFLSQNYEKVSVGGAAVAALALAWLGWSKIGSVSEEFNVSLIGAGSNNPAVAGAERVAQAVGSLAGKHIWTPPDVDGRPVGLFTGIPLYVHRDQANKPVDLWKDQPVHKGIDNKWWMENHLDPGFANSPDLDPDDDGFTNREEYEAKTNPNDANSHPPLIAKLSYVKDETLTWQLAPGIDQGGAYVFKYIDSARASNSVDPNSMVKPGEFFFGKGAMANRFKFIGAEKRKQMNNHTKVEEEIIWLTVEDQKPNKKGDIYGMPSHIPDGDKAKYNQYDRTAVLSLKAIGLGGQDFKVEERTSFALPPSAEKKEYLVKKVTPASIEVEYPASDGSKQTVVIPKGGLPTLTP
jgi:hypothetical protein